jgi:hypothetical protein
LLHFFSNQGRLSNSHEYDEKFSIPQHTLSMKNKSEQPREETINGPVIADASAAVDML